jgi:hypothetical protein
MRLCSVFESQDSRGIYLGPWVREIRVSVDTGPRVEPDTDNVEPRPLSALANQHLIPILTRATRLQILIIMNSFVPDVLSASSSNSHDTIEKLNIDISRTSDETLSSLTQYINSFQNLCELTLCTWNDWPDSHTPGLNLPKLTSLFWDSYSPDHDIFSAFVTRCHFNKLERLTIAQWIDPTPGRHGLDDLRRFLDSLSHLKYLAISNTVESLRDILPHLKSTVTTLDLTNVNANESVVALLPPSVRELVLSGSTLEDDPAWSALQFFENKDSSVRVIRFEFAHRPGYETPEPFTWAEGLHELTCPDHMFGNLARFTGRMLGQSSKLAKYGIDLVDEDGHPASAYFRLFSR